MDSNDSSDALPILPSLPISARFDSPIVCDLLPDLTSTTPVVKDCVTQEPSDSNDIDFCTSKKLHCKASGVSAKVKKRRKQDAKRPQRNRDKMKQRREAKKIFAHQRIHRIRRFCERAVGMSKFSYGKVRKILTEGCAKKRG